MKLKKTLAVLLVAFIFLGGLFAQGAQSSAKPVELTMYLLGDKSADFDMVFDKINAKLAKTIGATIKTKFLGWGEYEQKYPLVFASGEDFDLIYSADWAFYNAQATKGGFYEITKEALAKYAPMTAKTIYPEAWEQAKINGKVYMLPMNFKEITSYVYIVRGDLMKAYGMTAINGIEDFEKYLKNVRQRNPELIPLDVGSDFDMTFMMDRLWRSATAGKYEYKVGPWQLLQCIAANDPDEKVISITSTKEFIAAAQKLKEYKDAGFWSQSAVVNTHTNKESFTNGRSSSAMLNINDAKGVFSTVQKAHPEWDIKVFDAMGSEVPVLNPFNVNGMSVFFRSKNPDKALAALDMLRNDPETHDLFAFGIEGVHYTKASNGAIRLTAATSRYPYDGNCNWGCRNDKLWKQVEGGIPNYTELMARWTEKAKMPKYGLFNYNDKNMKNEVAAINEIFKSDYKLLCLGFSKDVAKDILRLQDKLTAAGQTKVAADIQAQIKQK